jgi:hypothetical protein
MIGHGHSGLSRDSFIIIVVCGVFGVLILLYILRLLIRSRRRNIATPLPPIQPLAHHREQQIPKIEFWQELPRQKFGLHSSRSSLLPKPSRPSSFVLVSTDDVSLSPVSPLSPDPPPPLPSRSFQDLSSSSFISSETDLPATPPHQSRQSSPRRPRPLSTSSLNTAGTLISRPASRHTLRGVPHAPYNQIQIVLPTPLAPSLYRRASLQGVLPDPDRLSTVDMWVPVGRDYLGTSASGN